MPWSREMGMPQPIGAIAEAAMNNRRVACIVLTFFNSFIQITQNNKWV
jgi:hypothetical protein